MNKLLLLFTILILPFQSLGRNVMTWVPVYGITGAKNILNNATYSEWIKNGVSHIGLQLWVPGDNGAVSFVTDYQFTYLAPSISQDVQDIVTWGNANNVKVMLCLYNVRTSDFDWTYAQQVINDYPQETSDNIVAIVNTYNLDGVDIDFEGIGDYSADKAAYASFLNILGTALHEDGKELSADMFSTPCYNAPNTSWESSIAPYVDFMNVMGYNDTYENNNTYFSYCPQTPSEANSYPFRYSYIENFLTTTQAVSSSKLNYGIPSWVDTWGGKCVQANILDIMNVSTSGGIAIWDLKISSGFWSNAATWDLIKMFKEDNTASEINAQITICENSSTAVATANNVSLIYYDNANQMLHLSGMEGDLYFYSLIGVLEKAYHVAAGENISLSNLKNNVYIIKFKTSTGLHTEKISLYK
jgi:hypothetical protein